MKNVIEVKADGTITDWTAISQKTIESFESEQGAIDFFNEEIELERRAGADVVLQGNDRAFFLNTSNRVYKIIDVQ